DVRLLLESGAQEVTADAAESVDSNLDGQGFLLDSQKTCEIRVLTWRARPRTLGRPRISPTPPVILSMTGIWRRGQSILVHSVVGTGDPELLGALVRGGEKAADPARDRILRQRRIGEPAQLLEACLAVLEAELAGCLQMLRHLVAEDLQGALDALAGGDGGARGAAQARVVEGREPVRGRLDLAPGAALLPGL